MPSGLAALLDDVAGIAKLAASSLDDVSAAAGKAGTKAAGVVIDDAAVTPRYVVGFTPQRELPIIGKIAMGSLKNKLVLLLPAAIALSALAPWAITPILMVGGAYLCFEGAEKLIESFSPHEETADAEDEVTDDPAHLEAQKVSGAIRTDLILSGEIMAIALNDVADKSLWEQAIVLAVVGILVTIGVYGVVALIVKMDDIGLHLAEKSSAAARAIGRGLVKAMPYLLSALSVIGTAAMIWVGGGIIVHGIEHYGMTTLPHFIHHSAETAAHASPVAQGLVEWAVNAIGSGLLGVIIGAAITFVVHKIKH
ncbi:DUF808 domain-containing protein [Sphingobium boeckii]|uniref:DUF808 domain-containing protein n=1 Tax=Sphingobium boeckii TaxID=1082345 RepID=A0A7W9AIX6_9SPHN|nr:DUF808 domain-containing protein [Sphingobium boeckii]MBB5686519.1 hypothetical protein [Sphingobium boeckii]